MTDVIRAVFFDMGNVLIHFSHERMCHQVAAVSGVDQDRFGAGAHEEAVEPQPNAVVPVGGVGPLPQHLGHQPEHGTAVQAKGAVSDYGDLHLTQLHNTCSQVPLE